MDETITPSHMKRVRSIYIGFAGQGVVCHTTSKVVESIIVDAFRPMLLHEVAQPIASFSAMEVNGQFMLRGSPPGTTMNSAEEAAGWIMPLVLVAFLGARTDLVWLHSAAVADGTGATLLVGESRAGKSTLATLLAMRGWKYLSDEVAPFDPRSMHVFPFPRSPARRVGGGDSDLSAEEVERLQKEVWIPPLVAVCTEPAPIARIVHVRFRFGAESSLREMHRGNASVQMLMNSLNPLSSRESTLATIVDLARRVPCYEMEYSDAHDAVTLL
jgi:hypothetical protein